MLFRQHSDGILQFKIVFPFIAQSMYENYIPIQTFDTREK